MPRLQLDARHALAIAADNIRLVFVKSLASGNAKGAIAISPVSQNSNSPVQIGRVSNLLSHEVVSRDT